MHCTFQKYEIVMKIFAFCGFSHGSACWGSAIFESNDLGQKVLGRPFSELSVREIGKEICSRLRFQFSENDGYP